MAKVAENPQAETSESKRIMDEKQQFEICAI